MIRFVLRFLGLCLLAAAFVFFVYDGTKSIANHAVVYTQVGYVWAMIDQNSLSFVQDWLKQHLPWAWDALQKGFDLPTWVVVGIVAAILILLGRKKKPLIGYGRD
jgi:drug/metabolite transporter (DMT)-like permease